MRSDPLSSFKEWEGESLGEDYERSPGFRGKRQAPIDHLHIAGAWGMSSARREGNGSLTPAVYLRVVAGVIGTGPRYHVLDGIIDADIAEELGNTLLEAAAVSRRDIAVGEIKGADS